MEVNSLFIFDTYNPGISYPSHGDNSMDILLFAHKLSLRFNT